MQAPVWIVAFVLLSLTCGCGTSATLVVPTIMGEVRLRFDPNRIPEQRLDELVRVGPYRQEDLLPRDLTTGEQQLQFINGIEAPKELDPVVVHIRRQVSFYLCLDRAKFAYYDGDDEALRTSCDDIDPNTLCSHWVLQAPLARSLDARKFLAGYTWHNCMNHEFRDRLGDYPIESWQRFLKAFGVEEEVMDWSVD